MALEIITPSYAPDFELCRDLAQSLRVHAVGPYRHTIVVPEKDVRLFSGLTDAATTIEVVEDFLPGFIRIPGNMHINRHRPFPPVRGWVSQQIVKLAVAARSDADVVVLADSDLVFVRAIDANSFRVGNDPIFYRLPDALDARLPEHLIWHAVSRRLLGLPPAADPPLPDYISWPCVWEPAVVRAMLTRIESTHRTRWQTAVGRELRFSEMILYGVFVDDLHRDGRRCAVSDMQCLRHTEEVKLGGSDLQDFLDLLRPEDLAIMISAKSDTDIAERRAALARFLT